MKGRTRILVVDDQPANIKVLSDVLAGQYAILVATSGAKALEIAAASPPPDLILLDVVMPDLDGFEVCRQLKDNSKTANIPVIFVTAKGEVEFETRGFELGAMDYIQKPFHPAVVLARVRTQIDRQRKLALLENLAFIDGLTELPNRRYFDQTFAKAWAKAAREHAPLSLLMLDIDFFKKVNDTYGHPAGDACLVAVAERIAAELHRPEDLVARLGGEEFAVLLPDTDSEAAGMIAQRLCDTVAARDIQLPFVKGTFRVTISIGCGTMTPTPGTTEPNAFTQAVDELLYEAKRSGRNRVVRG